MSEFMKFIREQGVIGLAIGFIMGSATGKVVSSLVADIVQPLIGFMFGSSAGLAALAFGPVRYGQFAANLLDFLIMASVVFFLFKGLRLDRIDAKKA